MKKSLNLEKLKINNFRITNIVANAALGFQINLSALGQQKLYIKNDKFPGLVYKGLPNVKSVLMFASGKLVFTGAKSKADIDEGFKELFEKMQKYATKPIDVEELKKELHMNKQSFSSNKWMFE